jgi:hypothetical protein
LIEIEDLDMKAFDDWPLRDFLDPESEMDADDAKTVVKEAKKRWSDLSITPKSVLLLKEAICACALIIPYAHLRGFLAAGHDLIEEKFSANRS